MSDQGSTTYRHPGSKRVRLALFWATNYNGATDVQVLRRAKEMLDEHGLTLDLWPAPAKTSQTTLSVPDRLIERADYDDLLDNAGGILSAANEAHRLVVIFCQFHAPDHGLTVTDTPQKCLGEPFCLVDQTVSSDNVTLLHEVGHAAGLDHDKTSTGATGRNFMNEVETRSTMMKWQVQKMAGAFYAK